jgi:hypothetical protein
MKLRVYFFPFLLCLSAVIIKGQTVEVNGYLKVTSGDLNNAANKVVILNTDGTYGIRDAATIGGEVPGTAPGDIKYWDGTQWVLLPAGPKGSVLMKGSFPEWVNLGKSHIVIQGNITNAQAAAQLTAEYGPLTQFVWIQNTIGLTTLTLDNFEKMTEIRVSNNANLNAITFTYLLNSNIIIEDNPLLSTLNLPKLNYPNLVPFLYTTKILCLKCNKIG